MPIGTHRRIAAGAAALALVATTLALLPGAGPAAAAAASYAGACTGADARSGVTVVVDFQQLDGNGGTAAPTLVRCSPATVATDGTVAPRTGHQALVDADLAPTGVARWGDAFVCRIDGRPAPAETLSLASNPRYRERCTDTPPAAAYWSYWYADGSGQDWHYSEHGVLNREVVPGGFEGWSFAIDATAGTNPPPRHPPVAVPADPDAPQVAVTADRPDPTLALGQSTTLRWTSRNAVRLTASGAWTGDLARPGGTRTVRPTSAGTHRYQVTARADDGSEVSDVLTLEVVAADPGPGPDPAPDPQPGPVELPVDLPVDPAARQVSGWLVGELVDGTMPAPIPTPAEPTDWGLTVDTLWALYAAGTGRAATRGIVDALDRDAGDYLGVPLFGDAGARRAGQTAKVLLAAVVAGRDPRSFGRVMRADGSLAGGRYDLRRETLSLVARRGPQVGRVRDRGVGIDNTNTFSQSLAVIALARSGGVPAVAVDYLLRQQCGAGYFRMFDRDDRTCDQDADAADGDGTALGLQALMAARAHGVTGLDDEIERGVAWLLRVQRRDGSFGGGTGTEGSNANSTGLVAQTLAAAGRRPAFRRAQAFVRSLSVVPAPRTGPLATERGAIAYDAGSLATARASGITGRDQWRRATTQAIFALAPVSFVDLGERTPRGEPEVPERPDEPSPATPPTTGTPGPGSPAPPPGTGAGDVTGGGPALTVPGSPSVAPAPGSPSGRLGAHLAASLVDCDHVEVTVGATAYVDYDLTAEVVLALRQTGEQPAAARRATRFLLDRRSVAAYVGAAPYERGATYVEPLAKLVLVALASDRPADAARAAALAERLAGRADPAGFAAGGADDDVAGTTRSAWAVLALTAAGRPEAAAGAVGTLVGAPCDDGLFPGTVADGGCATGDPVATALVVQALDATLRPPDSGPADAPADRAPSTWPGERTAALTGAGAALRSAVTVDGGLTLDDDRVSALAAVATALQAVGLDSTRTRDVLVGSQRRDGGLPATLGAAPTTVSDLATTAASAPAVAGTSWLTSSATSLTAQVLLPLAGGPDTAAPDAARSDDAAAPADPGPGWPAWAALALAAVALLFSLRHLLAPRERSTP
ncbi:hypothetical protein [Nocardioides dongxiaopingii]|uniref:hypothetical protein n=2 Tax=Nocardioides TaxID=1839 RepID=UPI0016527183|nr:hypothetical protein [Nocardioides sp. S-1144]